MVNVRQKSVRRTMIALIAALLPGMNANATVTASIDRADIELNESFTLELTTDSNIDVQPDITILEKDFYIGQSSRLSNTTIVNGQIRRSMTWTYVLMPKHAGEIVIPSITIGKERSNPLIVDISESAYAPPGEAEVFITTEVDFDETYVQAQVLLTVKIYRSVATRQPALRDPTVTGVEVLLELAGDDRNYEAIINGTAYSVVERVIAMYPQESGEIKLSPARFEARVLRNGRITGRKVYESDPLTITVLPTPAPPAGYPDATWLPARDLQLSEEWSRDDDVFTAGEPLTRHVTISVLGQIETQIPAIEPPSVDGINIYPDKPELSRQIQSGGIRGQRKDQYALIGVGPGTVVLPAVELPWWNIETGEWQIARLPERSLKFVASAEPEFADPVVAAPSDDEGDTEAGSIATQSSSWRHVSEFLVALWLATIALWWWSSRPTREPREPGPIPLHKRQAKFLKAARKAAVAQDGSGVRQALIQWGRLQWPGDAPRSIGIIAARVSSPLAEQLESLSKLSYGSASEEWDGEALARALRSFAVVVDDQGRNDEFLPPLMPTT